MRKDHPHLHAEQQTLNYIWQLQNPGKNKEDIPQDLKLDRDRVQLVSRVKKNPLVIANKKKRSTALIVLCL